MSIKPPCAIGFNPPFNAGEHRSEANVEPKVPFERGVSKRDYAGQVRKARALPIEDKRTQFAFIKERMPSLILYFNAFGSRDDKCVLLRLQQHTDAGWVDI